MAMSSRISSCGRLLSFTPLIHLDSMTRRVVSERIGSGMIRRSRSDGSFSFISSTMRIAFKASFLKSSSV